jgi:hypothetical protein
VCGDAIAGGFGRAPAPPPHHFPGHRVTILPVSGHTGDVGQLVVGQVPVNECQLGAFGQRVVLEPGEKPGGQRAGSPGAAVGVPVGQRLQQLPLPGGNGLRSAQGQPGEQPPRGRAGE